jgi:hypothetical protein
MERHDGETLRAAESLRNAVRNSYPHQDDVEGHEAAVLRGATVTLKQFSPILFLELHNEMVAAAGGNPGIAVEKFEELYYDIFATDGSAIDRNAILTRPIIRVIAKRRAQ